MLNSGNLNYHVEIGNFGTINPKAQVSGTVKIGNPVVVDVRAELNNNISIVDGVKIGGGLVVLKSVEKQQCFSVIYNTP